MKIYDWLEEYVPIFLFAVTCVVMLFQIFMRTIFGISFPWSVEVSQYLNVWVVFISIGYVKKMDSHIKIEMLFGWILKKLPKRGQIILLVTKRILNISFMVLLIWFGLKLSIRSWNFHSPGLQISQTWLYICVPLGAFGYLFREIQSIHHVLTRQEENIQ